jgi:protein required for attachment to host cells
MPTGGVPIAEAQVRVSADLRELYTDMAKAKGLVTKDMKKIGAQRATPKIELDLTKIQAQMKKVRQEMKILRAARADPKVSIDDDAFQRKYKELQAQLKLLERNRKIVIEADTDTLGLLRRQLHDLNNDLDDSNRGIGKWLHQLGRVRIHAGAVSLSVKQFGVALITLAPIIVNLVGAVTALAGSLGSALVGGAVAAIGALNGLVLTLGGFALALKSTLSEMGDVSAAYQLWQKNITQYGRKSEEARDAQDKFRKSLQALDPAARRAFTTFQKLRDTFESQTGPVRRNFFAVLVDGMEAAKSLMPTFTAELNRTAQVMRQELGGIFDRLRGSGDARDILGDTMRNFRVALPDLLHGLANLSEAIARIGRSGSRWFPEFAEWFRDWTGTLRDSTRDVRGLNSTVDTMIGDFRAWMGLLGSAGRLLVTVFTGGREAGTRMVTDLTQTFNRWDQQLQSAAGQASMRDFFSDSVEMTEMLGSTLRRVITILYDLSRAFSPIAQGVLIFTHAAGDVGSFVASLQPLQPLLAGIGAALATYFVAGKIIAFGQAIFGLARAFRAMAAGEALAVALANPFQALLGAGVGLAVAAKIATADLGLEQEQLAVASESAAEAMERQNTAMQTLRDTALSLRSAHLAEKEATLAVEFAERNYNEAVREFGKNSLEARQAELAWRRARVAKAEATRNANKEERRHNASLGEAVTANRGAISADKRRIQRLKDKRLQLSQAASQERQANGTSRHYWEIQKDLIRTEKRLKDARRDLHQTTRDANHTNRIYNRGWGLTREVTRAALEPLKDLRKQLNNISGEQEKGNRASDRADRAFRKLLNPLGWLKERTNDAGGAFRGYAGSTEESMGRAKGAVRGGTNFIDTRLSEQLRKFGFTGGADKTVGKKQRGGEAKRQRGGSLPRAQMGMVVPGSGSGDKVMLNALVEPGERVFVLNRNASQQLGGLMAMNSMFPRFQKGGIPRAQAGQMIDPPWDPGGERLNRRISGVVGGWARRYHVDMTAGYDPGGGHVSPGHNVTGTATDVIPGAGGSWNRLESGLRAIQGQVNQILYGSNGVGTPYPNHGRGNHAHIEWGLAPNIRGFGGVGGIKMPRFQAFHPAYRGASRGLNDVARAAERYGNRKLNRFGGGPDTGGGALGQRKTAALWRRVNPGVGDPHLMSALAMAESGTVPSAHGPPDGRGLYQIEWPVWGRSVGKFGNPYNAAANTRMARYVLQNHSTGLGAWVAYTNGNYRQFLQQGGLMQRLREGGPVGGGGFMGGGGRAPRPQSGGSHSPITIGNSTFRPFTNPWKWERRQKKDFKGMDRKQTRLRERIDIATRKSTFATGHWGEEVSPRERNNMLGLNRDLLRSLTHEKRKAESILKDWSKALRKKGTSPAEKDWIRGHRGQLRGRLRGLEGITGRGGEIFDVRETIAGLIGDKRAAAAERGLEQTAFGQERYDLFRNFGSNLQASAGVFAGLGGGVQHAPMAGTYPNPGPGSTGVGSSGTMVGGGNVTNNVTNNYLTQPEDPHTWSQQMRFELAAMG